MDSTLHADVLSNEEDEDGDRCARQQFSINSTDNQLLVDFGSAQKCETSRDTAESVGLKNLIGIIMFIFLAEEVRNGLIEKISLFF